MTLEQQVHDLERRVRALEKLTLPMMPIGPVHHGREGPDPKIVEKIMKGVLQEQQQRSAKEKP